MSDLLNPPFQLGQTVFLAYATSYDRVEVPCPICFGKRQVTLILGNGEQQPVECDYCGKGYDGPRGVVAEYQVSSRVTEHSVTGMALGDRGWSVNLDEHHCAQESDGVLFATREAAEARRLELHAEAEKDAERRMESILKGKKKGFTWTVGYHRAQMKDLKQRLEWHEGRLCKLQEKNGVGHV